MAASEGHGGHTHRGAVEFTAFCRTELPRLLRYALMVTGEPELARDIVQEVLLRAHGRWRRIASTDRPDLYVKRMIANEFISTRRRVRWRQVPLRPAHDRAATAAPVADDEVWARLSGLPRQQRVVLVLRYYEGLTDAEIAAVLGCTAGTVRGYASRALRHLRLDVEVYEEERR